jgi:methionyl aminopeptidase
VIFIKTKSEIEKIRESCQIVAETLQLVKKNVRQGVTTLELDKMAEDYIRSNDAIPAFKGYSQAGSIDFPGSLCTSVNEEVVHGIPAVRPLRDGDIISIDVGVLKNGFYGDAAISIAVGEISEDVKKLMKVTEESLHLAIEQAVAGNRIGDIGAAVQSICEENGFGVVRELCGHGVGKHLHEDPQVPNYGKKNTGTVLKEGMTIAIEPMVNLGTYRVVVAEDGWTVRTADSKPSAHFEHTIAIINGKPEILTVC